ncbi:MAG: hypothetical protein ABL930_09995 [Pseudobdellovibrio sp.]
MNAGSESDKTKSRKKTVAVVVVSVLSLAIVGYFAYSTLTKIKAQQSSKEASQEQFVGAAQISETLLAECQKSADKIVSTKDVEVMIAEYKKNADNCREVYFSIESKNKFRSEGMYPEIVVDIASEMAKTNTDKAREILNFAKTLSQWEFSMGPVSCNSKSVIDAYIESYSSQSEKTCFKVSEYKEKLFAELKNRNFSIFTTSRSLGQVASLGTPDSEVGCPEKISTIIKLAQSATSKDIKLEEEKIEGNESNGVSFIYKTSTEDKLILQFTPINECFELQSVFIPNLQTNE